MKQLVLSVVAAITCAITPALAHQHGHGGGHHSPTGHQTPYAGLQDRPIKALSEQQIAGLKGGKGMGMAMTAELNGYPGPLHVLELASQLQLTAEQTEKTKSLFAQMQDEAKAAGEEVIAAEDALDNLFQEQKADVEHLSVAVSRAAVAQGKLRETHLRYHLAMMQVLTGDQVTNYKKLRGY